jgi:ubiquitin carboxyl-terminal hydrolase 5/13
MPGSNGHGIEHYEESRHPIVVKLGTVTPESTADVHCYQCDGSCLDPLLGPHLAYWGFDIAASEKTEKSLMEMQTELGEV